MSKLRDENLPTTPTRRIKNWYKVVVRSRMVTVIGSRSYLKNIPGIPLP